MLSAGYKGVVLGDINVDMYGTFPDLPQKGQGINTDRLEIGLGGAGMNLTQMLKALNVESFPLANLGTGSLSQIAGAKIAELDIDRRGIEKISGKTGLFFCIITPDGDRTMFGYRGVNRRPINYNQRLDQLPPPAEWDFIFISAYLFLYSRQRKRLLEWLEEISEFLPRIKVGVVVSHLLAERAGAGEIDVELLNCCDVLFMNKDEFRQFAGSLDREKIRRLASRIDLEILAVTTGEQGSIIYSKNHPQEILEIAGFEIDPVDTTGAGDCFAAGFLAGKIAEFSAPKAAMLGNFCGAVAGLNYGISQPVKTLQKLVQKPEQGQLNRSLMQNMLDKIAEKSENLPLDSK